MLQRARLARGTGGGGDCCPRHRVGHGARGTASRPHGRISLTAVPGPGAKVLLKGGLGGGGGSGTKKSKSLCTKKNPKSILPFVNVIFSHYEIRVGGGGGWHKASVLFAFGGAYWPFADAYSDPLGGPNVFWFRQRSPRMTCLV